jgi:hypothetical protein
VSGRRVNARYRLIAQLATLTLAAVLTVLPFSAASAQGLFDALFGSIRRPPPSARSLPQFQAFAPPALFSLSAPADPGPRYSGRSKVYCVRLCDGRYFPLARHAGVSPAETCHSFCPASRTKTFSGGDITYAAASDGTRYSELANAFLYRKQVVAGCTCNGRDAFGLAPLDTASDPTLRKGDIVATRDGFVAYRGRHRKTGDLNFTPIDSYRGLSETDVVPAPAATKLPIDDAASIGNAAGRQAQLLR